MAQHESTWVQANQRYLHAALHAVREALARQAEPMGSPDASPSDEAPPHEAERAWSRPAAPLDETSPLESGMTPPPAMEQLCAAFGLSPFERQVLLLCAGADLEGAFASLCAVAQGDPARAYPTFSLALATFDEPHWSALSPESPLRYWRLIEVASSPGGSLTTSPLRIDERVLHFLAGVQHSDERLAGLIEPVRNGPTLVPSHAALAQRIAAAWIGAEGPLPLIQLVGCDEASRRSIAAAACGEAGLSLYSFATEFTPSNASEMEALTRLWERETVLASSALYVDAQALEASDVRAAAGVTRLLERMRGPLLLSAPTRWRPLRREVLTVEVRKPTPQEQRTLWQALLGDRAASLNGQVDGLVAQFNLGPASIRASIREAHSMEADRAGLGTALWETSRAQARPHLDDLAQRIEPVAAWDDLVLPAGEQSLLREIAAHVAHRTMVYETWGFGATSSRGLGISALFAGASGTGKTMAAEVLAHALQLDLYRVDLSSVVSKYIGETEKNLRRVFDAAEEGGVILFFDEADALFGKRSEVKDSHDRYANIEINYLLQRMESYRGLAVLATNMKSALDTAFLRRIRFVVNFPVPDAAQRAEIWRRVFPAKTPTEGLDIGKLARLNVAGGNIRNIALNAAFLAAHAGEPVRMAHVLSAARTEYAKLERPLSEAEIGGWQ